MLQLMQDVNRRGDVDLCLAGSICTGQGDPRYPPTRRMLFGVTSPA